MDVNKMLQLVDRLVFEHTGQHLNDVQRAVVEGTWNRQTYDDIAQNCHVTRNHVADVGSELWQLLSEALDEDIKKSNFRSNLERVYVKKYQNICIGTNHHFTFGSQTLNLLQSNVPEDNTNNQSTLPYRDLTLAPQIINFYGRKSEITTLDNWILNQNARLISVLGLSGIGKTTLVKEFIDRNLQKFEFIIWKKLKHPQHLDILISDLLKTFQPQLKELTDDNFKQLFDIFAEKKCLIILDDVHNIFAKGQFAGQYKTEYQNYQSLFTTIAETEHQSHVILISQEKCSEMDCLDSELYPIRLLELLGLNDLKIFNNKKLINEDIWLKLIDLHEGNPFYLREIYLLIKDVFDGNIEEFWSESCGSNILPLVTNKMQAHFKQLFNRLAKIEQLLILELSQFEEPLSRANLIQGLDFSSIDLMNGFQSLQRRYLVRQIVDSENKVLFHLSPVWRQYVKNSMLLHQSR